MEQSANSSLPSSLLPLFLKESKCETIYIKMSSAFKFAFMQFKLIFIMFCARTRLETRPQKQLGTGPFIPMKVVSAGIVVLIAKMLDSF